MSLHQIEGLATLGYEPESFLAGNNVSACSITWSYGYSTSQALETGALYRQAPKPSTYRGMKPRMSEKGRAWGWLAMAQSQTE